VKTLAELVLKAPVPTELIAATLKAYRMPGERPVIAAVVLVEAVLGLETAKAEPEVDI
jgi:hypothetical protein